MARLDPDLERFVREQWHAVVASLARSVGDRELAEDAVQEALARHLAAAPPHPIENLAAWVTVVARNVARDRLRAQASERRAQLRWGELHLAAPAAEPALALLDVRDALAGLPEGQRRVCVLRFLAGRSVDQIARELGVTSGTVKTQLHRARRRLQVALAA